MRLSRRHVLAMVTVLATLSVAGVALATGTGDPPEPKATTAASGPPVIAPGRPGEAAAVLSPGTVRAGEAAANPHDANFLRMMIPHHRQAIEMAALAPSRATNPQLKVLAERIRVAQVGEIAQYESWLRQRGLGLEVDGHDHAEMPGMQTPEAMRDLAAASGDAFDRMFVDMMVEHHRGAVTMANAVLTLGVNPWIEEVATSVAHEQSVEIDRMRAILAG